jgi:hydroxymethylbilane synthase
MKIGTRGSALALAQSRMVADAIEQAEIVVIKVSGDGGDRAGGGSAGAGDAGAENASADKSRWVDAIERALLDGSIDLAVHSAKDVPVEMAPGLALIGSPPRADARDALCGADSIGSLAPGARVGTSSLRRAAQLRSLRDDLEVVGLGGNIDTRLRRLDEGDFDAIVLARAGLERLKRNLGATLDELVPAAGQGLLALQARAGDDRVARAVEGLRDAEAEIALRTERALVEMLGADCRTALGAHARLLDGTIELRAWIGRADGSAWLSDELAGEDPERLALQTAERLLAAGAAEMLAA